MANLAIERQHYVFLLSFHQQFDNGVIRHDERPVGKRERADRRDDDRIHRRKDYWTTRGEIVGRRTRWGGNDQTIGAKRTYILLVQIRFDFDDARERRFIDYHVVEYAVADHVAF